MAQKVKGERLFLAATLPETWLRALRGAGRQVAGDAERFSLTKQGNEHLTWIFLGDLPHAEADRYRAVVRDYFGRHPLSKETPLTFRFDRWVHRGRSAKQGYLIAAALEVSEPHRQYVEDLSKVLRRAGADLPERNWWPHVTLARRVHLPKPLAIAPYLEALPPIPPQEPLPIEQVVMFESKFTPQGVRYIARDRYGVGG